MISFQQLCEELTAQQRYSFFYLSTPLVGYLNDTEVAIVYLEKSSELLGTTKVWYPRSKYVSSPIAGYKEKLMMAIKRGDMEEVEALIKLKNESEKETQCPKQENIPS